MLTAPKFKLAERGVVERIGGEPIAVGNAANLFEPALGTLALRDGDGTVERNYRRRTDCHQHAVKRNDLFPVSLLGAGSHRMDRCDRGLHVILGQLGTRC